MGSTVSVGSLCPLVIPSLRSDVTVQGHWDSKYHKSLGLGVCYMDHITDDITDDITLFASK